MGGGHRPPKREEEVERKEATFPISGNVCSCVEGAVDRQSAPQLRAVPAGRVERDPEKGMVNGHEKRCAPIWKSRRRLAESVCLINPTNPFENEKTLPCPVAVVPRRNCARPIGRAVGDLRRSYGGRRRGHPKPLRGQHRCQQRVLRLGDAFRDSAEISGARFGQPDHHSHRGIYARYRRGKLRGGPRVSAEHPGVQRRHLRSGIRFLAHGHAFHRARLSLVVADQQLFHQSDQS